MDGSGSGNGSDSDSDSSGENQPADEYGGVPAWIPGDDLLAESRRYTWLATLPLVLLLIVAVVLLWSSREDSTAFSDEAPGQAMQSEPADDAADDGGLDGPASVTARTTEVQNPDETNVPTVGSAVPVPPSGAPYVDATLTDNVFVLSGVVPDQRSKQLLESKAALAYAPFFSSELTVDESVEQADWLAAAPEVVGLLPMITDGTIRLQDNSVTLAGRSPNPEYASLFEGAVGLLTGLPVSSDGIEITDLSAPRFVARVAEGEVMLEGEIPSAAIAETIVQGAAAVYGADRVTSTMTIDGGTYTSFWMYTMPGIFQLLRPFPAYEIRVVDGVTSGAMQGGVVFALNESDISPEAAEVLGVGVALLSRDRSLEMTVIGHTDNQGPTELNQRLSLERAQSVIDFLASNGIDPQRLTAEGKGPDEPIASNDTPEGRSLNRRVEFVFD